MSKSSLHWIGSELASWTERGLRRDRLTHSGAVGVLLTLAGKVYVNFGSNDYLSLAADQRIVTAAQIAASEEGWGSGASPLVNGRATAHEILEQRLAKFEGTEAALLFSSGFAANAGVIPAVVGKGDTIYSDAKNHASIIDGCRLSGARVVVYPHSDTVALERLLAEGAEDSRSPQESQQAPQAGKRLIVTDTLFSMEGDLAPIVALADLAEKYEAMFMVDEAHATGVFGPSGRGVVELLEYREEGAPGLHKRIDIRVGTLSKACGTAGGFVAGSQPLIEWLSNHARSYVFSTAQPAATAAAAVVALDLIRSEPKRRARVLHQAAILRAKLLAAGWKVGNSESQIIPLLIGSAEQTMRYTAGLKEHGFFVPGIRPPTVPQGESLLRISLCYGHTDQMLARLITVLEKLRKSFS